MKYLQDQLQAKKGKIVWLASYPKSGNTWFRCFLSALFTGQVDLEFLKTDGIFSSRQTFDSTTGVDSRYLHEHEIHRIIPEVYRRKSKFSNELLFIKTHDAYTFNDRDNPIIPADVTHRSIYFVRNPLDIVGSFANHNNSSIEDTIKLMNNKAASLPHLKEGVNNHNQIKQSLLDWSGHVSSWTTQNDHVLILVQYEEMLKNPSKTFSRIMSELEFSVSREDIEKAIDMASFSKLKQKEEKEGFKEKNIKTKAFFRSGTSGSYINELTEQQIQLVKNYQGKQMQRLGYL